MNATNADTGGLRFLLVTPARNEEERIERFIANITTQTVTPVLWVIVSDGSTDRTDDIVRKHAASVPWIRLVRHDKSDEELHRIDNVAVAKARAVAIALETAGDLHFDYIGNIEPDIEMADDYYELILQRFSQDQELGIAGGFAESILPNGEATGYGFFSPDSVGGPIQMFRRECYAQIGGYKPYGMEDGIACDEAKRLGWKVRAFSDIRVRHHVPYEGYARTIRSKVPMGFRLGMMNYVMRIPFWFTMLAGARGCFRRPFVHGPMYPLGHLWALLTRKQRIPKTVSAIASHMTYAEMVVRKLRRQFA